VGMNTSVNLARPAGKAVMLMIALLLFLMPFTGVIMGYADTKPITLTLEESVLSAKNGSTVYTIKEEDIYGISLEEELPKGLSRTMGTGMEHLYKGQWRSDATGTVTVMLDPTKGPYLLIRTEKGSWYLLGCREAETTRAIYEQLK